MSAAARKFLIALLLLLLAGLAVGWLYGRPLLGLLTASLLGLLWQVRQLLSFERATRTGDFDHLRYGDGIWEQLFSRARFERDRGLRRKVRNRELLKEIRRSTDAMPDGAVILDASNEIVVCNRAAKSLAGLKRHKDRGQRIDNILRDPKLARLVNAAEYDRAVEILSPVRDGNWLNCRIVPYGAEQKLLLLRDVTERIQLSKMRRDFVANASHELRSPLTVINGYLDALADDSQIPENWRKPVSHMRAQGLRMNQMLGDLMELSRLESAGPVTADDSVDIVHLLKSVHDDNVAHGRLANISINAESSAELLCVRSEIESVVVNLLSNALRHTPPEGEVSITWRSSAKGADLIVKDTGEGIATEYIPRLTERFFRVDRGRSRGEGGVGLGLSIVKHVMARHGGELRISSSSGQGSEFCCHFPPQRVVVAAPVAMS